MVGETRKNLEKDEHLERVLLPPIGNIPWFTLSLLSYNYNNPLNSHVEDERVCGRNTMCSVIEYKMMKNDEESFCWHGLNSFKKNIFFSLNTKRNISSVVKWAYTKLEEFYAPASFDTRFTAQIID